jgi:8-oxo-dGTP pyrophosphatase MutT (NUDIX family)
VDRKPFIRNLEDYNPSDEDEKLFKGQFLEVLNHPDAFQRFHLPGHLTASAWIVDLSKKFVLLTHHAKLNKWLQPGGHADGDENLMAAALREAEEETGLKTFTLLLPEIFDIDIHTIPARKEFPEHQHFDVRYLLQTDRQDTLILSEESHALAWIPSNAIQNITNGNRSMIRMANKVSSLFGTDQ